MIEALRVHAPTHSGKLQQRVDFGGKRKPISPAGVVKGLDAEEITGQNELSLRKVEDGKGKHPHGVLQNLRSPLPIALEQNLRVRLRVEPVTQGLQLSPQFKVIVDLAIMDDHLVTADSSHRLPPGFSRIKDGKSAVGQDRFAFTLVVQSSPALQTFRRHHTPAEIVRPPVMERSRQTMPDVAGDHGWRI